MIETKSGVRTFYARSRDEWHTWLERYGRSEKSVCLIVYHETSRTPSVHFQEAIEEAACFGWFNSWDQKRDEESSYLVFLSRKPKNAERIPNRPHLERIPPVHSSSGHALENRESDGGNASTGILIPPDLQEVFERNEPALQNFRAFSHAWQRGILKWISQAKTPEIRRRRIEQTVKLAARNLKPLL